MREDPAAQEARDREACRKEAAEGWLSEWMMFCRGRVLVVGDGNLSFSLALARAFPNMQLIATTFDSEDFVLQRYGARDVISELKDRQCYYKSTYFFMVQKYKYGRKLLCSPP